MYEKMSHIIEQSVMFVVELAKKEKQFLRGAKPGTEKNPPVNGAGLNSNWPNRARYFTLMAT